MGAGGGILDVRSYPEAVERFRWDALWELFDGSPERLNLAHECVDRHAGRGVAVRLQRADGGREEIEFAALSAWSSRFAGFLERAGIAPGDRVAVMLDPGLLFYAAVFGTVKRGAIAVPLFTLFGPDGLAMRVRDCAPRLLLVAGDPGPWSALFPGLRVLAADEGLLARLDAEPAEYAPRTAADDLAVFQYTSGTTRARPEAVRHTHRAVVTLMVAALYGLGLERTDRYFCPSSPAWGHGLWHGTIAPLALGVAAGAYSGKFDAARLLEGLSAFGITNMAAASTVYRMIKNSGLAEGASFRPAKLSFTGEPMDSGTWDFLERAYGTAPRSMYGSTEVGVILVNYPGFAGYAPRRGALGKPAPGVSVAVIGEDGAPLPPGRLGEIAVRRKGGWFPVKDRGHVDADGYVHHAGRSDDAIISAGFTMSAVEIEDVLLTHPDVREAAVVGVPDELRGQVAKAFIVAERRGPGFAEEIQAFMKARLGRHEYPRQVEVVDDLPKTPAGKVNRQALREGIRLSAARIIRPEAEP